MRQDLGGQSHHVAQLDQLILAVPVFFLVLQGDHGRALLEIMVDTFEQPQWQTLS